APPTSYTLSLHDALPICRGANTLEKPSGRFQTSTSAITSFLPPLSLIESKTATIRQKKKEGGPAQHPHAPNLPLAAGAYAPITTALPAGSISDAPHPTKPPAAGIYPPGRRHKSARFHAPGV